MKKVIGIFVVLSVVILSTGFVSAGLFDWLFDDGAQFSEPEVNLVLHSDASIVSFSTDARNRVRAHEDLFDGDLKSRWATKNNVKTQEIIFDLGAPVSIGRFEFTTPGGKSAASGVRVFVANTQAGVESTETYLFEKQLAKDATLFENVDVTARFVKVKVLGNFGSKFVSMNEIEIFGDSIGLSDQTPAAVSCSLVLDEFGNVIGARDENGKESLDKCVPLPGNTGDNIVNYYCDGPEVVESAFTTGNGCWKGASLTCFDDDASGDNSVAGVVEVKYRLWSYDANRVRTPGAFVGGPDSGLHGDECSPDGKRVIQYSCGAEANSAGKILKSTSTPCGAGMECVEVTNALTIGGQMYRSASCVVSDSCVDTDPDNSKEIGGNARVGDGAPVYDTCENFNNVKEASCVSNNAVLGAPRSCGAGKRCVVNQDSGGAECVNIVCTDSDPENSLIVPGHSSGIDSAGGGHAFGLVDECVGTSRIKEASCNANGKAVHLPAVNCPSGYECVVDSVPGRADMAYCNYVPTAEDISDNRISNIESALCALLGAQSSNYDFCSA